MRFCYNCAHSEEDHGLYGIHSCHKVLNREVKEISEGLIETTEEICPCTKLQIKR